MPGITKETIIFQSKDGNNTPITTEMALNDVFQVLDDIETLLTSAFGTDGLYRKPFDTKLEVLYQIWALLSEALEDNK